MKLKPSISIYKISDQIFVRNQDQIFELEGNKKALLKYIKKLEIGVGDDFKQKLSDEEQKEFEELCLFLEKNFLLDDQKASSATKLEVISGSDQRNISINIITQNKKFKEQLTTILKQNGLMVDSSLENSGILVFVKDQSTNEHDIQHINERALKNKKNWLFVDLSMGTYGAVGPLMISGVTACYNCFVKRKVINDDTITKHDLQDKETIKRGDIEFLPWQYTILASIITNEVSVYNSRLTPITTSAILYVDFSNLETWKESLLRYPRCELCEV